MTTYTKGDVIIEDIEIGDVHYEYGGDEELKVTVVTKPILERVTNGHLWTWTAYLDDDREDIIEYAISPDSSEDFPLYSNRIRKVNLEDYEF